MIYLKWIFYVWLTLEERQQYRIGKAKGMHCETIRGGVAKFQTDVEPYRNYLTWKEFKEKQVQRNKV